MDISLLKTFLEVARTRHFGKAADALFVTQSAVSARIKLLESNLGVELFDRRRNDIQLSSAGLRLVRHAETIVRGWQRARHEIALGCKGAESLAVGSPFDLWGILLRDWAASVRSQWPQLVLQIEVQPSDILVGRLVNGLLDLTLLFEPPQIPDLAIRQVAEVSLILVSGRSGCSLREAVWRDYYMVDWGSVFALNHAAHFPDIPPPAARGWPPASWREIWWWPAAAPPTWRNKWCSKSWSRAYCIGWRRPRSSSVRPLRRFGRGMNAARR